MDNDDYNPEEPIYYNYKAKEFLLAELPQDSMCYDNIYICSYDVNTEGKYPFLRFLLTKTPFSAELFLPQVLLFKNADTSELIEHTKGYLAGLLNSTNIELFNETVEFDGFLDYNNSLYLFFNITKCKVEVNDIYRNSRLWLALMDEIVNYKHICNIPINQSVVDFFILNEYCCFLLDKNENNYEIPLVCYVAKPENKLNFTLLFGEPKTNKNAILGPYYYFKDFHSAFKECGELINGGVVRFAAFVGNTKFIENNPNDPNDESDIKAERLHDETIDQNMERLTMRITDHDGNWTQDYDSAYLGNFLELDNGIILENPVLVVKEYKQQIPLSYHYIDKRTLTKTADEYSIM